MISTCETYGQGEVFRYSIKKLYKGCMHTRSLLDASGVLPWAREVRNFSMLDKMEGVVDKK